ncbi:MAG: hypothetical protein HXS40_06410 [Theionarchaea archaeon]|nr:hypothetical protein [Theionarchaea archaeon]
MASIFKKVRNRPVNEGDEIDVINREIVPVMLQVIDELGRISGDVVSVVATSSVSYAVKTTDFIVLVDAQAGGKIYIPDAKLCKHKILVIKNKTTNVPLFLITNDDANIDVSGSKTMSGSYSCVVLVCDGEDWWIIAEV